MCMQAIEKQKLQPIKTQIGHNETKFQKKKNYKTHNVINSCWCIRMTELNISSFTIQSLQWQISHLFVLLFYVCMTIDRYHKNVQTQWT